MSDAENKRIYWHSRRGMLELDIILMPFAKEVYPTLDVDTQESYRKLLACEDSDLFAWFLRRVDPDDEELTRIVKVVLSYAGSIKR